MPLQHEHILNPITALEFYQVPHGPLLILAGEGSFLKVFDAKSSELLSHCNVLGDQAIHGIKTRNVENEGHFNVQALVWGGSSLAIFRKHEFEQLLDDQVCVQRPFEAPDWILDAALHPGDAESVHLITAHNTVVRARVDANSHFVVDMQASPSRSILYSAHLVVEACGIILVAAGTVFGEIIVWTGTSTADIQVLFTFIGHEGSIFGVHMSPLFNFEGGREGRLLASCSDDRTIRVWELDMGYESRTSDGRLVLTKRTGLGSSNNSQPQAENPCIATVMAHASRIWRVKFLMSRKDRAQSGMSLLSFGEDSITHQWSLNSFDSTTPSTEPNDPAKTTRLTYRKTFASHGGKHIWSTALHYKDESSLVILATGGADGKISLHDVESNALQTSVGSTDKHSPTSENPDLEDSWDLEQDILQEFSSSQPIDDKEQEKIWSEHASAAVAQNHLVAGKTPKAEKAKKVVKDVFNKYAFASEDRLLLTTTFGRILLGKISKHTQWEEITIPPSVFNDLKSYSVLQGVPELGLVFLAGTSGKIYMFTGGTDIVEAGDVEGKVADMFKIFNSNTGTFELLVTILGTNVSTLFQIEVLSATSLHNPTRYQIPEKFVVTSAGRVDSLIVLGSRNGSLAIYGHQDGAAVHQASSILSIPIGDAITTIIPLSEPNSKADTLSYFLTTRRDGMYSIFTASHTNTNDTKETIRCVHEGGLPFGPMIESAWYDQGNLFLYGFKSTKFLVWNETQQLEVMNVDCGGAHRNYAYSPLQSSSGGHFAYTKASRLHTHSQQTPSHTILKSGGHGREIKACAVSPDGEFFATGAEDTRIRIWSYSYNSINSSSSFLGPQFNHQAIMQKHSAGIQHLQWHNSNYLLSSGGNEELFIWSIERIPGYGLGVVCEASCPDRSEEQDLRIMNFDVGDVSSENKKTMLISLAYSDSTMRSYLYSKENGFALVANGRYTSACLTQIRHLEVSDGKAYISTAATDGNISLWKVDLTSSEAPASQLKFLGTQKIHQSTIKSLDYTILDDSIIVVTGGDDNALGISIYSSKALTQQTTSAPQATHYILRSAHAAAITGLCILPIDDFSSSTKPIKIVSSGNDQRVKEWNIQLEVDPVWVGELRVVDIRKTSDEFTSIADVGDLAFLRGGNGSQGLGEKEGQKVLIVGNGMEVWRVSC